MNIEEAFGRITANLKVAKDSEIEPSIRVSGPDWVCTIDHKETKFVIIVNEGQLMLVSVKSKEGPPDVQRIQAPGHTQQELIDRVLKAITDIYGRLPAE
jgi:hypothetical protein